LECQKCMYSKSGSLTHRPLHAIIYLALKMAFSFCPVTQINLDTMRHMVNLETNWTEKIGTYKMALMCAKAFERFSSQNQQQ